MKTSLRQAATPQHRSRPRGNDRPHLRALAVTSAVPSAALPDTPVMADFVSGFEASAWFGVVTPKNTPTEIIEKLNKEINAALADQRMNARFADLGAMAFPPGSPAEFGKFITHDTEKWGKVVKSAGIKIVNCTPAERHDELGTGCDWGLLSSSPGWQFASAEQAASERATHSAVASERLAVVMTPAL
jgi:hypothetical protein